MRLHSKQTLSRRYQWRKHRVFHNSFNPRSRQHFQPMITSETNWVSLNVSSLLNVIISYCFNMTLMNFLAKVLLHHLMHFYFLSFFRSFSPVLWFQLIHCHLQPFCCISFQWYCLHSIFLLLLLLFNSWLVSSSCWNYSVLWRLCFTRHSFSRVVFFSIPFIAKLLLWLLVFDTYATSKAFLSGHWCFPFFQQS